MTPAEPDKAVHAPPGDRAAAVSVRRGLGGRKRPQRAKAGGQLACPAEEEVQHTQRGQEPERRERASACSGFCRSAFTHLTTSTVS